MWEPALHSILPSHMEGTYCTFWFLFVYWVRQAIYFCEHRSPSCYINNSKEDRWTFWIRAMPRVAVRTCVFTHNALAIVNQSWLTITRASWDLITKRLKIMLFWRCCYKALFEKYSCNFLMSFDCQTDIITLLFSLNIWIFLQLWILHLWLQKKNIPCAQRSPALLAFFFVNLNHARIYVAAREITTTLLSLKSSRGTITHPPRVINKMAVAAITR